VTKPAGSAASEPQPGKRRLRPADVGWTKPATLVDFWELLADPDAVIPFGKIVSAHWLTLPSHDRYSKDLRDQAYVAERAMRERFERQYGRIQNSYFCRNVRGGCVLVEMNHDDGRGVVRKLFTSLGGGAMELVLLLGDTENVVGDAVAAFARKKSRQVWRIRDLSDAAYATATRLLSAADAWSGLADEAARKAALDGARAAFATTRQEADVMIQRAARFRYFGGVQIGAVLALAVCATVGWLNARYWSGVANTAALTGATVFGVLGAVASVFQRTSSGRLFVDYKAPRWQTIMIAGLRPFVGAVLGLVSQFALVAVVLASLQNTTVSSTSFGFFALVGF
jgi:hypothetical protein